MDVRSRRIDRGFARQTLGPNIRLARRRAGFTQDQLASALGVTDYMIVSKWERGLTYPTIPHLVAIAEVLRTDVGWLCTFAAISTVVSDAA